MEQVHPSALLAEGTNGASVGISVYINTEFLTYGAHADQEGFVIAEGEGEVYLDGEIRPVGPGTVLILQPGVSHAFRSKAADPALKVYWFHAAV